MLHIFLWAEEYQLQYPSNMHAQIPSHCICPHKAPKACENLTKILPRMCVCEGLSPNQFQTYRVLPRSLVYIPERFYKIPHLKKPTKQPPAVVEEPGTIDSVSEICERNHQGSVEKVRTATEKQLRMGDYSNLVFLGLQFLCLQTAGFLLKRNILYLEKVVVKHLPLPGMCQFSFSTTPPTSA